MNGQVNLITAFPFEVDHQAFNNISHETYLHPIVFSAIYMYSKLIFLGGGGYIWN